MPEMEFIDALIGHLEREQLTGRKAVTVSDENRALLREAFRAKPAAPVARSMPAQPPTAATQQMQPPQAIQAASAAGSTPPQERFQMPARLDMQASQPQVEAPAPERPQQPALQLEGYTWEQLEQTAQQCQRCALAECRKNVVFGAGNRDADIMFIGDGPDADEDQQGIPLVGEAGQLLSKIIGAMGMNCDDVYIANIVKCRPPGNRNPEDDETATCMPILKHQIDLVNPKVIVLLGAVPLKYLMNVRGLMRSRGSWMKYGEIDVMPTFHPGFLTRKPEHKREVWTDMQLVMQRLGIPLPAARTQQRG